MTNAEKERNELYGILIAVANIKQLEKLSIEELRNMAKKYNYIMEETQYD